MCISSPGYTHQSNMPVEKRKKATGSELANVLPPEEVLFGRSEAMRVVRKRAAQIGATNIPILLCGPIGSGKEVLSRWIHGRFVVASGQFGKLNGAAGPGIRL